MNVNDENTENMVYLLATVVVEKSWSFSSSFFMYTFGCVSIATKKSQFWELILRRFVVLFIYLFCLHFSLICISRRLSQPIVVVVGTIFSLSPKWSFTNLLPVANDISTHPHTHKTKWFTDKRKKRQCLFISLSFRLKVNLAIYLFIFIWLCVFC